MSTLPNSEASASFSLDDLIDEGVEVEIVDGEVILAPAEQTTETVAVATEEPRQSSGAGGLLRPSTAEHLIQGIATGARRAEEPTVGLLALPPGDDRDPLSLLYRGRVNGIAGESGSGKSWTAMAVALDEIESGNSVLYVDYEDSAEGIYTRALAAGADPDTLADDLIYFSPEGKLDEEAWTVLESVLDQVQPSLVVIDSTGEALSTHGANPNADEEVAEWVREVPRRIARHRPPVTEEQERKWAKVRELRPHWHPPRPEAPAVLVLDHVTKSASEGGGSLSPIGSQRKRAAIDGTLFIQRMREPFSRGVEGYAELVVSKDRHGHFCLGDKAAVLRVAPDDERPALGSLEPLSLTLEEVPSTEVQKAAKAASKLDTEMAKLDDLDPPPRSKRDVMDRTGWGDKKALDVLRAWRERQGLDHG